MGTPTFLSIIIPVYKVEPYLRECLNSIATSTLDCWEAILIDDGSPDGCPQICDDYAAKDKRFRVIHQENAGVAAARNAGLDMARGEWIWFVDSDDVINSNVNLNLNVNLNVNNDVDLVVFGLDNLNLNPNLNNNSLTPSPSPESEGSEDENDNDNDNPNLNPNLCVDKNSFLLQNVIFHHQRLWYKKELLDRFAIRFTKGVRLAEDLELMYKYMTVCQHPIKYDTILYYYRVHEGSATQNDSYRVKAVEDLHIVLDNLAEWIRKYNIKPEPWLDLRIKMLFQNLLYSASQVKSLDVATFQQQVQHITDEYFKLGFPFVNKFKNRLAKRNVKLFFLFNKFYLKCVKS